MRAFLLLTLTLGACSGGIKDTLSRPGDDTGVPVAATFDLAADSVDFGEVAYGDLETTTVAVSNAGTETLLVSSISVNSPFQVTPSNMSLAGGTTTVITIYVQVTSYEAFSDVITFVTDDETIGTLTLPVTATTITDADGDGYVTSEAEGGDDCDDEDPDVNPGEDETWYDDIDQNCDGASDYDQDGDGYETEAHDGDDCIDTNANYHPGAADVPYDNADTNCDGQSDWDYDGDGYGSLEYAQGSDCDDYDATVNLDGLEALNGKDDDCNGESDDAALAENSPYIYEADGNYDQVGYSIALGDLDDDGNAEVIIGVPYHDATTPSGSGAGGVGVFQGPELLSSGTDADRGDNWFEGDNSTDLLGAYVSVVGDFDGNGYNDLAVSATGYAGGGGAVYLLDGDDATRRDISDAIATFTSANGITGLGRGLATSIDLDGDGLDELMAAYANGPTNCLAVQYGTGSPVDVTSASMDALFSGSGSEVAFYRNAPVGGDLDGDGYEDLVVSDGTADYQSYSDAGALWVVWGQTTHYVGGGFESAGTTLVHGNSSSAYRAWSSQLGEDWDGDGDAELWVYDNGDGLYVYEGGTNLRGGSLSTTDAAVSYEWNSSSTDAELIRRLGDYTGDGVDEMIVFLEDESGAYGLSEVFSSELQSGDYDELDDMIGELGGSSDAENGNVGYGMAPIGADIDGDGDEDFAVGDPNAVSNEGRAYVLINGLVTE